MPKYLAGKLSSTSQDSYGLAPSYASKILGSEKHLEWNASAISIHNKIRALYPWPVVQSSINGVNIKLIKSSYDASCRFDINEAGTIVDIDKVKGIFVVATSDGALLLEKVQPFGKKEMTVKEFVNGYRISKGMRFNNA